MGLSASIYCPSTDRTVSLAANSNDIGKHLLNIIVGDPQQDIKRFHVPGTDGNAILRCGQVNQSIDLVLRYIHTLENIKILKDADLLEWSQNAVSITDDAGQTWTRMNLVPGSFKELRRTTITGPLTYDPEDPVIVYTFFEFSVQFQQD